MKMELVKMTKFQAERLSHDLTFSVRAETHEEPWQENEDTQDTPKANWLETGFSWEC